MHEKTTRNRRNHVKLSCKNDMIGASCSDWLNAISFRQGLCQRISRNQALNHSSTAPLSILSARHRIHAPFSSHRIEQRNQSTLKQLCSRSRTECARFPRCKEASSTFVTKCVRGCPDHSDRWVGSLDLQTISFEVVLYAGTPPIEVPRQDFERSSGPQSRTVVLQAS